MSRSFAIAVAAMLVVSLEAQGARHVLRMALPVAWQLTYTRLVAASAPSVTESFRETWWLEVSPSGFVTIASPRAKVAAFALGGNEPREAVPKHFAVTELDFGRLVGVQQVAGYEPEELEVAAAPGVPVFLHLGHAPRDGTDVDLVASEDETHAVHFEVGADGLY